MQAEDLAVFGGQVGVLYGEVYDYNAGLTSSGARLYKGVFDLHGAGAPKLVYERSSLRDNVNKPDYKEHLVFVGGGLTSHSYATWNASTETAADRVMYGEIDEAGAVGVAPYSVFGECFERTGIVRTANGSLLFAKANPQNGGSGAPMFVEYYDAASKTWLSSTAPYQNGMNLVSTENPGHPPLVTSALGFSTGEGKYRVMLADLSGAVTVLQPNQTDRHGDVLGKTVEPALAGQIDLAFVGGTTSGDTFYGLVYSKVAKALYEYRWNEGESTVTKAFGPIPFAAVRAPMTVAGNWRYFELKPDGTAYTLMPADADDYDVVLSVVGVSGVREVGRIARVQNSGVLVGLPRYADGYYYAVAYVPFLAGGERAPQLDIVRIKE